jgi:ribosomal protein S18 acetylase RimI-like enzyme
MKSIDPKNLTLGHIAKPYGTTFQYLADAVSDELTTCYVGTTYRLSEVDRALCVMHRGMVVSFVVWRPWGDEPGIFMGLSWTMPNYRRLGLYKRLIQELRRLASSEGYKVLRLCPHPSNRRSQKVHEALGMSAVMYETRL